MWMAQRSCSTKTVVDRKPHESLASHLPNISKGDQIEVGFVGHWLDYWWTLAYLDKHIVPLAKKNRVSVVYDNTACSVMSNPEHVQGYLLTLDIPKNSQIVVKGSQGLSMGMWDSIFWGTANFYAFASTEWKSPRFLPCDYIEDKICSSFQGGEKGRCNDSQKKSLEWLYCKKPKFGNGEHSWQRRKG